MPECADCIRDGCRWSKKICGESFHYANYCSKVHRGGCRLCYWANCRFGLCQEFSLIVEAVDQWWNEFCTRICSPCIACSDKCGDCICGCYSAYMTCCETFDKCWYSKTCASIRKIWDYWICQGFWYDCPLEMCQCDPCKCLRCNPITIFCYYATCECIVRKCRRFLGMEDTEADEKNIEFVGRYLTGQATMDDLWRRFNKRGTGYLDKFEFEELVYIVLLFFCQQRQPQFCKDQEAFLKRMEETQKWRRRGRFGAGRMGGAFGGGAMGAKGFLSMMTGGQMGTNSKTVTQDAWAKKWEKASPEEREKMEKEFEEKQHKAMAADHAHFQHLEQTHDHDSDNDDDPIAQKKKDDGKKDDGKKDDGKKDGKDASGSGASASGGAPATGNPMMGNQGMAMGNQGMAMGNPMMAGRMGMGANPMMMGGMNPTMMMGGAGGMPTMADHGGMPGMNPMMMGMDPMMMGRRGLNQRMNVKGSFSLLAFGYRNDTRRLLKQYTDRLIEHLTPFVDLDDDGSISRYEFNAFCNLMKLEYEQLRKEVELKGPMLRHDKVTETSEQWLRGNAQQAFGDLAVQ